MDEIAEGFLRTVFKIVRWFLVEAFIECLCFYTGKYTLRLMTLGLYPNKSQESVHETRITLFGLLVVLNVLVAMVMLVNS